MTTWGCRKEPVKYYAGAMAVAGGLMIFVTFGTIYTFGNMNPYFVSYMRQRENTTSIDYSTTVWIFSLASISQGAFMPVSGQIERWIGTRTTCLIGCCLFSTGVLLTSVTIDVSLYAVLLTYGLVFGAGIGIAYPACLSCAMRWFPDRKATVSGVIVFGFGASTLPFDFIQTLIINPDNLSPDAADAQNETDQYFSQQEILSRVPHCLRVLAATYIVLQLCGILLLRQPPSSSTESTNGNQELKRLKSDEQLKETDALITRKVDETLELTPRQVLHNKYFYMLYGMFLCNQVTVNFMSALYKAFGLEFIKDDMFLVLIGSLSSVFNACGRLFWGVLADQTSFRRTMCIIGSCNTLLVFTIYYSRHLGPVAYLIWVCAINFVLSGVFAICPAAAAKLFGATHFSTNYGMVFSAAVPAGILAATLTSTLLDLIGWLPMFCMCALCYIIATMLAYLFDATAPDGSQI